MSDILIIHGPNLNKLGHRETEHYGTNTLATINQHCMAIADPLMVKCLQSNHEGEIVDWIQNEAHRLLILNAAAYTHSSIAIRDALLCTQKPFIEVHMSNTFAREDFRQQSFTADLAKGVMIGLGEHSYYQAVHYAKELLTQN